MRLANNNICVRRDECNIPIIVNKKKKKFWDWEKTAPVYFKKKLDNEILKRWQLKIQNEFHHSKNRERWYTILSDCKESFSMFYV